MKNILLIGKNLKSMGEEIWRLNKDTYFVSVTNIKDKDFLSFVYNSKTPILCILDESYLDNIKVNDMMELCETYNFVPMFVSISKDSLSHKAFLTLNNRYRDSMEYDVNEDNVDYDEFLKICVNYLHGKDE